MNNKELQLCKNIGRKDLSFGCVIKITTNPSEEYNKEYILLSIVSIWAWDITIYTVWDKENNRTLQFRKIDEIISHPLLLTDVLNGLSDKWFRYNVFNLEYKTWFNIWDNWADEILEVNLSKPLFSDQSEEFKEAIFLLFNIK